MYSQLIIITVTHVYSAHIHTGNIYFTCTTYTFILGSQSTMHLSLPDLLLFVALQQAGVPEATVSASGN